MNLGGGCFNNSSSPETRTRTLLSAADFESSWGTNSANNSNFITLAPFRLIVVLPNLIFRIGCWKIILSKK
jgi:hypothetical protein